MRVLLCAAAAESIELIRKAQQEVTTEVYSVAIDLPAHSTAWLGAVFPQRAIKVAKSELCFTNASQNRKTVSFCPLLRLKSLVS